MSFTEFEQKKYEKLLRDFMEKRRPPAHLRDEVDLGCRMSGNSVEIFEIRPFWNDPGEKVEEPVARATYVKTQRVWKIYWQRCDLKWHMYEPDPEVDTFEEFLDIVDADEYATFWG